ncbi:MAG: DMT family transporter [Lachnospiraceae bacterium]
MNSKTLRNSFLLFLTACIWGLAFVSQSKGMEVMGPFSFNGIRSLMGAAVVFPLVLFRLRGRKEEAAKRGENGTGIDWKVTLLGGLLCGLAYTAASNFQQFGLSFTSIGKAGFITTLYIIFVPILGIFLKKRVPGVVWIGALMAAVGMYLLCMTESFSLTIGDTFVFICALLFAVHILIIDYYSPKTEGVILSCMQLFVCGVISLLLAFVLEKPTLEQVRISLVPLLYAGIMSCGVAYTLQIIGQKGMNPTVASLILSLESVVATLAGWLAYRMGFLKTDQTLTARQILGCAIVFAAVILVQLPIGKKNK